MDSLTITRDSFIRGNSIYNVVDGPTWIEAEANANKLGGHLVTINDAEEHQWLDKNFKGDYWIGLSTKGPYEQYMTGYTQNSSSTWTWADGDTSLYRSDNWSDLNAYTSSGPLTMDLVLLTKVGTTFDSQGDASEWKKSTGVFVNPVPSENGPSWTGKKVQGIAEIKLDPNNAPIGEPKINGNLKVGETITVDISNIQDDDNFTGYTPTYNYSWQVLSDNGISWSDLRTADATDNNSSFLC